MTREEAIKVLENPDVSKTRKAYGYKWMWAGERKEGAV